MSQSGAYCHACSATVRARKKKKRIRSAALIPKLSADSNRFSRSWWKIWFYSLYACPPRNQALGPSTCLGVKEREREKSTSDLWVCREINLLFSQLITSKMHVYQSVCNTLILMDYMHYGRAADLICIPRRADYKITLLMHWFFLHPRLMALMNKRERGGTEPVDKKKKKNPKKRNKKNNKWR